MRAVVFLLLGGEELVLKRIEVVRVVGGVVRALCGGKGGIETVQHAALLHALLLCGKALRKRSGPAAERTGAET